MTAAGLHCHFIFAASALVLSLGCNREPSAHGPQAAGSSEGQAPSGIAPGPNASSGIHIETPITATSRLVFGGHEWKRDPTGSTEGSSDLPEMSDDGIEDSFTTYLTDDPNLRLFYMLTGNGHRIYVRERHKETWVTMKKLLFED
jgi:hypothetical protein